MEMKGDIFSWVFSDMLNEVIQSAFILVFFQYYLENLCVCDV